MKWTIGTLGLALVLSMGHAQAQYRPEDVPDTVQPEQVAARVAQILERLPERTVSWGSRFTLTYKALPADVQALLVAFGQTLSANERPRGVDLEIFVRQYQPQVRRLYYEALAEVGTLTVHEAVEIDRKDIPPAEYRFGVAVQNDRPAAIVLQGGDLPRGRPLALRLRQGPLGDQPDETLTFGVVEPDDLDPDEPECVIAFETLGMRAWMRDEIEQP